uniref:Uncharacterized protein n=1 Tax=Arundo donax TaxID=35708 RepID=A0A0A9FJJ7_ARUDO
MYRFFRCNIYCLEVFGRNPDYVK